MPYIKQDRRKTLASSTVIPKDAGELNYLITELCDSYLTTIGKSYQNINQVVGALECAKLEFYRRVAAPYEDLKKEENGDVYTV